MRGGTRAARARRGGGKERALAKGIIADPIQVGRPIAWSPDGRWLAFFTAGTRGFTNVSVVPAAGGEASRSAFSPTRTRPAIAWSPDGTFLLFDTGQRTEVAQLARVDSDAAHAEVPRGSIQRSVQRRASAEEAGVHRSTTPPKPTTVPPKPAASTANGGSRRRRTTRRPRTGRHRLRRHPPAALADPLRPRRRRSVHQPRRQDRRDDRRRRRAAEPVFLVARRNRARAPRRAAADDDRRRQGGRLVHARQQGSLLPGRRAHPGGHARPPRDARGRA